MTDKTTQMPDDIVNVQYVDGSPSREWQDTRAPSTADRGLCEIREIYCNMEGFVPETAGEAYVLQEIKRMYDTAIEHIKPLTSPPCVDVQRALDALDLVVELAETAEEYQERDHWDNFKAAIKTIRAALTRDQEAIRLAVEALEDEKMADNQKLERYKNGKKHFTVHNKSWNAAIDKVIATLKGGGL